MLTNIRIILCNIRKAFNYSGGSTYGSNPTRGITCNQTSAQCKCIQF